MRAEDHRCRPGLERWYYSRSVNRNEYPPTPPELDLRWAVFDRSRLAVFDHNGHEFELRGGVWVRPICPTHTTGDNDGAFDGLNADSALN